MRGRWRAWSRVDWPNRPVRGRGEPPGLVQQVGLRPEAHRLGEHLAGVARVRDRPAGPVRLVAAVALAHLGVVGEAAGGEEHALAGADRHRSAVADGAHADDAAVLDQELFERRLGPDGDPPVERDLEHLPDEGRAVRAQRLAAELGGVGPQHDPTGDHEGAEAPVVVGQRTRLVGHHGETEALGQSGLQPRHPFAQDAGVPRHRLDPPSGVHAALRVGVVVAVAAAVDEANPELLKEGDHLGARREEGVAPFERRARADVTDDRLEVRHGVLVGVGHARGQHHRVVRHPDDPAGHARRAADQRLLLEHERARPGVGRGECRHHATAAGSDDHDVDGGVPRRHVTTSLTSPRTATAPDEASRPR